MKIAQRKNFIIMIAFLFSIFLFGCNTEQPTSTPPPAPKPPEVILPVKKEFSFIAVGDNLIHNPIYEYAWKMGGDHYDFKGFYTAMEPVVQGADIAFLNQEVTVAGEKYGIATYPMFNSPKELAHDMAALGFDIVNQATNHSLDKGIDALIDSVELWHSLDVEVVGIYPEELGPVQIIERDGVRFAFLGYNYGLNGMDTDDWKGYKMTFLEEEERILADVRLAKGLADFVIVSFHWGDEYHTTANDQQIHLATMLAQENVDLIIGHHPHVIQPVELLARSDGKMMPVYYSLGNFISNQDDAINLLGGMACLTFVKEGDLTYIEDPRIVPLVTHYDENYKATRVLYLTEYGSELASTHGMGISPAYLMEQFQEIIPEAFRAELPFQ